MPPAIQAIVDAPDRTDADRALDKGRHPGELLAFFGLRPGMHVAELGAGGGYTTELLARAVGPGGKVWRRTRVVLKFVDKPWTERLAKPIMKDVVRVDRELEPRCRPRRQGLDAVVIVLFYHDTVWLGVDREDEPGRVRRAQARRAVRHRRPQRPRRRVTAPTSETLHRIDEPA